MPLACLPALRTFFGFFQPSKKPSMTHDVEQSDGAASARPAKRQKTMAPTSPPPPIMCCVCREPLKEQEVGFSCPHCRFGIFCRDCLRGWFLKATVDETRMPVKCCDTDVPVKKLKGLLTVEEVRCAVQGDGPMISMRACTNDN